jgi:hypothetical protein
LIPTQDEPEGSVMLGSEHPHGSSRRVEFLLRTLYVWMVREDDVLPAVESTEDF